MYEHEIQQSGLRIKVLERRGRTLKSQLQSSNPFKRKQCGREDCFICTTSNVGNCSTEGVTYAIDCQSEEACQRNAYKGETGNNGYTRGGEHVTQLRRRNINYSPLWRHCVEQHGGRVQPFSMAITGTFRGDAMLRQITEAVHINNTDRDSLMNTKAEWHMSRVPRAIIARN